MAWVTRAPYTSLSWVSVVVTLGGGNSTLGGGIAEVASQQKRVGTKPRLGRTTDAYSDR